MKVVLAGDWHSRVHEEPMTSALQELGHTVVPFRWSPYFDGNGAGGFAAKVQNKYLFGPTFRKMNRDLIATVRRERPDLTFIYRGTHVVPRTVRELKRSSRVVAGYNNDDAFSPLQPRWLWRHFVKALPEYDVVFAYRDANLRDFREAGAPRAELLRSWFVPGKIAPVVLDEDEKRQYACDVVFIGHYENDGRLALLEDVVKNGYSLRIFGPGTGFRGYDWDDVLRRSPILKHLAPVHLVWDADYNKALCGAKIALSFFSKLNRDTYTRRTFEIPAAGVMMLSEFSEDLSTMFREGEEADFFRTPEEFVRKLKIYLGDDERRRRVATAGRERVLRDGHDIVSRMRGMVKIVGSIQEANGR